MTRRNGRGPDISSKVAGYSSSLVCTRCSLTDSRPVQLSLKLRFLELRGEHEINAQRRSRERRGEFSMVPRCVFDLRCTFLVSQIGLIHPRNREKLGLLFSI